MYTRSLLKILAAGALLMAPPAMAQDKRTATWQKDFAAPMAQCKMVTTGRNDYFVMEPGFQSILEGGDTRLQITVLNETKTIDNVLTRVIEEREWKKGELYEVARNYFAMCEQTKDVYYFGEDVDFYEKGKVVKHDGTWHAGGKNKAGLIMPGTPKPKMKYYQELAPGVAMDRAEIISVTENCKTPAGTFAKCMKVKETSDLDLMATEYKYYAPGIGLIRDSDMQLTQYGFVKDK
jgi:hypothetical protein